MNKEILPVADYLDDDLDTLLHDRPLVHFDAPELDELLGVKPGLILGAGSPGTGKTSFMYMLAEQIAVRKKMPVLFFSFEVKRHLLVAKSLARISRGKLPLSEISSLESVFRKAFAKAAEEYRGKIAGNIIIVDRPVSPVDISAMVSSVEQKTGLKPVVFLDYVQITPQSSSTQIADERLSVKETICSLRRIVNNHGICLYAVSSSNRSGYDREYPGLGNLAECNALEYTADTVFFLSVKGSGQERAENMLKVVRPVTLSVLKNRYGGLGSLELMFDTRFADFSVVTDEEKLRG